MIRADGTEHSTACAHCLLAVLHIVSVACAPTPETTYAERFIEGGPIRASLGLAFDASDRLFVASIGEIVVVDRDSGEILDRIGQERGVQGAVDDLDFGVDGSLYWTEFFAGGCRPTRARGWRDQAARRPWRESDHGRGHRESFRWSGYVG